jgi:hypothetical protein
MLKTKPDEPYSPAKQGATGRRARGDAPVIRHTRRAMRYTSYVSICARWSRPE